MSTPPLKRYSNSYRKLDFSYNLCLDSKVRTLIAYSYNLEAPTGDTSDTQALLNHGSALERSDFRSYRAEKTYSVTSGKWYFEIEVQTIGLIRIGWATTSFSPSFELGGDEHSYAFDVCNARKATGNSIESFGKQVCIYLKPFLRTLFLIGIVSKFRHKSGI